MQCKINWITSSDEKNCVNTSCTFCYRGVNVSYTLYASTYPVISPHLCWHKFTTANYTVYCQILFKQSLLDNWISSTVTLERGPNILQYLIKLCREFIPALISKLEINNHLTRLICTQVISFFEFQALGIHELLHLYNLQILMLSCAAFCFQLSDNFMNTQVLFKTFFKNWHQKHAYLIIPT